MIEDRSQLGIKRGEIQEMYREGMEGTNWCNIGLIIFLLFIFLKLIRKQGNLTNNPPSPPSLPLIGHLQLIKEPLHQTLELLSLKYGDNLLLRFGVVKVLLVCSPSAVEECFTKNDIVFANRPVSMASTHLTYDFTTVSVVPYGELWRNLRRLVAVEIFSPNRIAFFTDTRKKEINLMLSQLMHSCNKKVDLKTTFNELAFNILSMTIGGKRYYGENVEDAEEARQVRFIMREMLDMSGNSNMGDFLPFLRWVDFQGGAEDDGVYEKA